jgi:pilus assembly protein FimV
MDMGDPDGARNILEEVLTEGSAAQKKEAQRLIESLPG